MTYVCEHCGAIYEEDELNTYTEINDWEREEEIVDTHCLRCGSKLEEGVQCCACGEWHTRNQLYDYRFCEKCLEKFSTSDLEQMLKIGDLDDYKETIQLNGLLASVFSPKVIEHILATYLRCMKDGKDIQKAMNEFVSCDYEAFAENLPCGYGVDRYKEWWMK